MYPEYTRLERLADGLIHAAGVTFSIVAATVLIAVSAGEVSALEQVSLAIYGAGLIAMFLCSALYNLVQRRPLKDILRRLDHAAIFVMIAGSYTPFALGKIGGETGVWLFLAVWSIALAGMLLKLFFPHRLERFSVIIYLAQGWLIVFAIDPLLASVSYISMVLLVLGGVIYSVGIIFHLLERLPFHNAIWHGFVLVAAACHYVAIYDAALS